MLFDGITMPKPQKIKKICLYQHWKIKFYTITQNVSEHLVTLHDSLQRPPFYFCLPLLSSVQGGK